MSAHPLTALGGARKEMFASAPAAPGELAFVARNLSATVAALGRVAQATGERETAAMSRILAPRLYQVAMSLSEGLGKGAVGSRGEVVTNLSAEALAGVEFDEDSMSFAEAAGIAAAVSDAIRGLNKQVRLGVSGNQWQHLEPAVPEQLKAVVEVAALLKGHATHAVISGKALGRREQAATPAVDASPVRPKLRIVEHETNAPEPGRGMERP
jgi:hypothetical protein